VNMAGTDRFPFIIGQVEGQDVIQLDANVYVLGTLSASQIRSGDIAVDQQIRLGNGNMILDGAGAMIVYNPNSPDLDHPDYAFFNAGRLTFQVYRDGAYQEQKAVKRVEFGVANSGETVFIPGYWDSQPKLMIGPKNLMSFREDFVAQNQSWLIEPRNFRETSPNSQRWQFDAIAELNLSENSGTITAGSAQGWGATNTFTSLAYNLIGNTSQITVNFVAGSYRGTGTNTNVWAYRAVRWKIQLYNNALGQWQDVNSFRVVSITAQGAAQVVKTDSATVAVSSAHTQVRIYAESYDSGGAYSLGGDTFTYWQGDVGGNAAVADCIHGPTTAYCTLATPNVPAGYSIYQVDYYYQWRYEIGFGTQEAIEFAQQFRFYGAGRGWGPQSFVHDAYDQGLGRVGNWQQVNLIAATSYFDANLMYVQAYNPSQLTFQPYGLIRTQGVWARVYAKRLNINSSTPVNYFQFQSFAWVTPSAATIANGSLNWFAVGE
jgi:hypothetical protein